jgi:hypothetical protein
MDLEVPLYGLLIASVSNVVGVATTAICSGCDVSLSGEDCGRKLSNSPIEWVLFNLNVVL